MSHEPKQPIGWMDKPDFVKRLFQVLYVLAGLLVLAEIVLGRTTEHPHPYGVTITEDHVALFVAPNLIGTGTTVEFVNATVPMNDVSTATTKDRVTVCVTIQGVCFATTINEVIPIAA